MIQPMSINRGMPPLALISQESSCATSVSSPPSSADSTSELRGYSSNNYDVEDGHYYYDNQHHQHTTRRRKRMWGYCRSSSSSSWSLFGRALSPYSGWTRVAPSPPVPRPLSPLHMTSLLPLLVLIDMFAVSLVVPLLVQYYKDAGVTSPSQRELLSSLFSSSQIAGGLMMGVLTDSHLMARKTILLVSFAGSAVAYLLIVVGGGLLSLIASRLLVGLVKQTMTVTTTLLTHCTTPENRAYHMGRLSAASTVAWIAGPTVGAILYQYVDPSAPLLVACALFLINLAVAALWLEDSHPPLHPDHELGNIMGDDDEDDEGTTSKIIPTDVTVATGRLANVGTGKKPRPAVSLLSNFRACFNSRVLAAVVVARLVYTWTSRTTDYTQLGSFYEDMYGLQPYHRGYISSLKQFLQFVVQSCLVAHVMKWSGNERRTVALFSILLVAAVLLELTQSLYLFVLVLCPLTSLSTAMTNLSLQTLLTHVAPTHSTFSVLAALDVLQNAVSVTVPFYRTLLFRLIPSNSVGDPHPLGWILSSTIHWLGTALLLSGLLLSNEKIWYESTIGPKSKGR